MAKDTDLDLIEAVIATAAVLDKSRNIVIENCEFCVSTERERSEAASMVPEELRNKVKFRIC